MGRGRSKAGDSKKTVKNIEKQSTEYLEERLKILQDRQNEIARNNPVGLPWSHWEELKDEFYSAQREGNRINDELQRRYSEEAEKRRREQPQQARTFVNSFGEATTREITSQTYERAMRRQDRELLRFMGVTPQRTTSTRRRRRRR